MANTTNLGLGKLAGTEKLKTFPSMQAENMDTLDTAIGAGFGKNSKPSISQSMKNLGGGMAVLCDNNTHAAIPAGHYAYVMNHGTLTEGLYQNLSGSQIAANATLSGSNLTAVSGGGLNSLYSNTAKIEANYYTNTTLDSIIDALDSKYGNKYTTNIFCSELTDGNPTGYYLISKNSSMSARAFVFYIGTSLTSAKYYLGEVALKSETQYATERVFFFQVPPNLSKSISAGTHCSFIVEGFIGESGSVIIGIIKFGSTLTVRNLMTGEAFSDSKLSITVSGTNVVFTSLSTQNSYFTIIKGYGQ